MALETIKTHEGIRPFSVNFPEEALADLRRRLGADTTAGRGDCRRLFAGSTAQDCGAALAPLADQL
jgi:hypothetical protein